MDVVKLTPEQTAALYKQRRGRNLAMLVVLVGMVVMFFALTIVKLSQQ